MSNSSTHFTRIQGGAYFVCDNRQLDDDSGLRAQIGRLLYVADVQPANQGLAVELTSEAQGDPAKLIWVVNGVIRCLGEKPENITYRLSGNPDSLTQEEWAKNP